MLVLFILPIPTLSEVSAHIDFEDKKLIVDENQFYTPFIVGSLMTAVSETTNKLILHNEYLASATSKSVERLIINKEKLKIQRSERITFKPFENVYLGWVLIMEPTLGMEDIGTEDSLNMIRIEGSNFDYSVENDRECKNVRYLLSRVREFSYCLNSEGIYTLEDGDVYIAQYTFDESKKVIFDKMLRCDHQLLVNNEQDWLKGCTSISNEYALIAKKTYLHTDAFEPTKMYLIKGDKVTLLNEQTDSEGQKWYYINYQGKKDLNMWIKAEAIDVEDTQTEATIPEARNEKTTHPKTLDDAIIQIGKAMLGSSIKICE